MSVIGYSHHEVLQAIAATWAHGSAGSTSAHEEMERLADQANAFLYANNACYNLTYGYTGELWTITADQIKRAIIRADVHLNRDGLRALAGFRYNLISNGGTDFATVEIMDFILTLQAGQIKRAELAVKGNYQPVEVSR